VLPNGAFVLQGRLTYFAADDNPRGAAAGPYKPLVVLPTSRKFDPRGAYSMTSEGELCHMDCVSGKVQWCRKLSILPRVNPKFSRFGVIDHEGLTVCYLGNSVSIAMQNLSDGSFSSSPLAGATDALSDYIEFEGPFAFVENTSLGVFTRRKEDLDGKATQLSLQLLDVTTGKIRCQAEVPLFQHLNVWIVSSPVLGKDNTLHAVALYYDNAKNTKAVLHSFAGDGRLLRSRLFLGPTDHLYSLLEERLSFTNVSIDVLGDQVAAASDVGHLCIFDHDSTTRMRFESIKGIGFNRSGRELVIMAGDGVARRVGVKHEPTSQPMPSCRWRRP
jgi:hypothetical protein